MSVAFLSYILPQLYDLIPDPYPVSENYVDLTIFLTISCVALFFYGYIGNGKDIKIVDHKYNNNSSTEKIYKLIFILGIIYTIIGFACNIAIGNVDIEQQQVTRWTGILTIYAFFQRILYVGFAINLHCVLRKNRLIHWLMLGISSFWPIFKFLFYARRTEAVTYIAITMLTLWFTKGYIVNRKILFIAAVIGLLFINSIGIYRGALSQISIGYSNWQDFFAFNWFNDWLRAFQSVDWWNETTKLFQSSNTDYVYTSHSSETKYAASVIQLTNETKEFGYGSEYWNRLVFGFIPAQFLGEAFKKSLYISVNNNLQERILNHFYTQTYNTGYIMPIMGELFYQFWFFGFLICYFIGKKFKQLWIFANANKKISLQIFYPIALAFSVTLCLGGLSGYLYNLICFIIFCYPIYLAESSKKNQNYIN